MESGSPKIYTRTGDKGKTSLIGGTRVSKSHLRLEAYGTIDELNSWIGMVALEIANELETANKLGESASATGVSPGTSETESTAIKSLLDEIQRDLFNVGSQLACEDAAFRAQLPGVGATQIQDLERAMDRFSAHLKPLKNFILPGGSRSAAQLHVARTVCRRAERLCVALSESEVESEKQLGESDVVRYVNRLSDFLFVLARYMNHLLIRDEPIWAPRKG